jgi:cobalamin biosynthesis protein CobW
MAESAAKVPATIITGFLGAGKTTLIRNLLDNANGKRIALIINEFGDVGVDADILRSCGIENCPDENIVELANGCICCTVADDFLPTLNTLLSLDIKPDHIVIETSGLALPKPLVQAFQWPDVRSRLTVDGVIAVIDGPAVAEGRFVDDPEAVARQRAEDPSLDHENPLEEVYEDQLLCADMIVLNKVDLLDAETRERVADEVKATVPRAVKLVMTQEGRVDPAVLLGLGAAAEDDLDARPSHHDGEDEHDHEDFESFVVDVPSASSPDALIEKLRAVAEKHDVLRIKGFVSIDDKPMRLLVQGVGTRFQHHYDRVWTAAEERRGRIVVIGQDGLDEEKIRQNIAR